MTRHGIRVNFECLSAHALVSKRECLLAANRCLHNRQIKPGRVSRVWSSAKTTARPTTECRRCVTLCMMSPAPPYLSPVWHFTNPQVKTLKILTDSDTSANRKTRLLIVRFVGVWHVRHFYAINFAWVESNLAGFTYIQGEIKCERNCWCYCAVTLESRYHNSLANMLSSFEG